MAQAEILFVDDELAIRKLLERGLRSYGYNVQELETRTRTMLQRSVYKGAKSVSDVIHVHDLTIDLVYRRVRLSSYEVQLTPICSSLYR